MVENKPSIAVGVASLATLTAVDICKVEAVGKSITFAELDKRAGLEMSLGKYNKWYTVQKWLLKEHSQYWSIVPKERRVLRHGTDGQRDRMKRNVRTIHRKSRWTMTVAKIVKLADLSPDEQRDHLATTAQMATVAMFTTTKTRKLLVARKVEAGPDIDKLIELMT